MTLNVVDGSLLSGSGQTSNLVTITDDDTASLSVAAATAVTEGGGGQSINVTLTTSSATLEAGVTISADIIDAGGGDALSGTDHAALNTQTITFVGGDGDGTVRSATIIPADDQRVEGNETVNVTLQNLVDSPTSVTANLATTSGVVTIDDNDTATIVFSPTTSAVGEADTTTTATIELTVTPSGSVGDVGLDRTVAIEVNQTGGTATEGAATNNDYTYTDTTLTFTPFSGTATSSQAVTANIRDEIEDDNNETIILSLQNLSTSLDGQVTIPAATDDHTITITDDDDASGTITFDASTASSYRIVMNGTNLEIYQGATLRTSAVRMI